MIKKGVILGLFFTMLSSTICAQSNENPTPAPITITANESSIHIQNAAQMTLEVFNITGVKVATFKIDSADKILNTNLPKGYYILKIGKVVRRVAIQ